MPRSSSALQRQPLALRRGLQLLGLLADSADVQEQLVEGRALEVRIRVPCAMWVARRFATESALLA